jgi:hypothetical protein
MQKIKPYINRKKETYTIGKTAVNIQSVNFTPASPYLGYFALIIYHFNNQAVKPIINKGSKFFTI